MAAEKPIKVQYQFIDEEALNQLQYLNYWTQTTCLDYIDFAKKRER